MNPKTILALIAILCLNYVIADASGKRQQTGSRLPTTAASGKRQMTGSPAGSRPPPTTAA